MQRQNDSWKKSVQNFTTRQRRDLERLQIFSAKQIDRNKKSRPVFLKFVPLGSKTMYHKQKED